MYRFLLVLSLFAVGGCAGTSPQSDTPDEVQVSRDNPAEAMTTSPAPQANESSQNMVARNNDNDSTGNIDDLESPGVKETSTSDMPVTPSVESAVICERVYPTGSILPVRVCRDVSAAARKTEQDQRILRDVKTNSAIGGARAASCPRPPCY